MKISSKLIAVLVFLLVSTSCIPGASSSPTPIHPTPKPQPTGIEAYADSVEFIDQVFFDSGIDDQWMPEKATWQDGEVQITGDQNWGSFLMHLVERKPNYGVSTRFKFKSGATFSLALQHGTWNTDDYREIGFAFFGEAPLAVLTFGKADSQEKPLQGSLRMLPEDWYQASYFVNKDGTFLITVWQEDNVANNGYFTFKLDEPDRQTEWRFAAMANQEIIYIDSIEFFDFAALHDPTSVSLAASTGLKTTATKSAAAVPTATVLPTATPVPVSFSEGAERGSLEELKRFGIGGVYESEYSPDGNTIAFGTAFGLYFFDPVKNEVTGFIPSTAEVGSLDFSPDGKWIAYGTGLGEVIVWDIAENVEIISLANHTAIVENVLFSPDQQFLISSDMYGRLNVFQTSDWSIVRTHELGTVYSMEFLPDSSKLLVSTGRRGVISLDSRGWGILNQYKLVKIEDLNYQIQAEDIAISPDGKYMAVAMVRITAIPIIELTSGNLHTLIRVDPNQTGFGRQSVPDSYFGADIYAVAYSNDGKYLAFTGNGRTGLVDLENEGEFIKFLAEGRAPQKIEFSSKGDMLLMGFYLIRMNKWKLEVPLHSAPNLTNYGVVVSPNPNDGRPYFEEEKIFPSGKYELDVDQDKGTISLRETGSSQPLFTSDAHTPMPFSAFGQTAYMAKVVATAAKNDSFFITGGADKLLKLWQVAENPEPRVLGTLQSNPEEVAISPDSKYLAARDFRGTISLLNIREEDSLINLGTFNGVYKIIFSPNSSFLAATVNTDHIIIWDLTGDAPVIAFEADQSQRFDQIEFQIEELLFSPDSKVLVSGYLGAPINIWSTADGSLLTVLDNRTWVTQFQFSEDGTILYVDGQSDIRWWGVKQ